MQELMAKLKIADTRSENAEMDIQRLNVRIDKEILCRYTNKNNCELYRITCVVEFCIVGEVISSNLGTSQNIIKDFKG